jgi:hypothetical protein
MVFVWPLIDLISRDSRRFVWKRNRAAIFDPPFWDCLFIRCMSNYANSIPHLYIIFSGRSGFGHRGISSFSGLKWKSKY